MEGNAFCSRGLGLKLQKGVSRRAIGIAGSSAYLGQHSRGGLHFGGEVKPQLRASKGTSGANPKTRGFATPTKPPCVKEVENWRARLPGNTSSDAGGPTLNKSIAHRVHLQLWESQETGHLAGTRNRIIVQPMRPPNLTAQQQQPFARPHHQRPPFSC